MIHNKFWLNFSSAYGTIWAVLVAAALVSRSHIDTGEFGMYGFPLIALIYAFYKRGRPTPEAIENERLRKDNERLEELVRLLKKEDRQS